MSHRALKEEMKAVARGEKPAPRDAALPTFESVEALIRLLTPENRHLLSVIRDRKPQSIAELAELTGRAPSNLARTLSKLEAIGLITIKRVDRRKVPTPAVRKLRLEIDPYSDHDHLEFS
jgi:predicted transcriptional regulator